MSRIYSLNRRDLLNTGAMGLRVWITIIMLLPVGGCGVLNPAFLNLFDTTGTGQFISIENAPGHVIVTVINNATIDERMLSYLREIGALDNLSDLEISNLKPRIRMRLRITFVDGNTQTIEFITGSPNLVDPAFSELALADVNQNDFSNAVVLCDVASVQLEPGTSIEVFVPVQLTLYDVVEANNAQGGIFNFFQVVSRLQPQFLDLAIDDRDEDGNVILQRNIDVRNVLSPVNSLLCGSVVAVVIGGVLSVPFLDGVDESPSYDQADESSAARVGGRYEFRLSVR